MALVKNYSPIKYLALLASCILIDVFFYGVQPQHFPDHDGELLYLKLPSLPVFQFPKAIVSRKMPITDPLPRLQKSM